MEYASLTLKLKEIGILEHINNADIIDVAIHQPLKISLLSAKQGRILVNAPNATQANLRQLGNILANFSGLRLNNDNPTMSIQLPTGERVQYSMPPATDEHITITIRRYSKENVKIDELQKQGAFDNFKWLKYTNYDEQINLDKLSDINKELIQLLKNNQMATFLKLAVKNKKNILISGQTGSGKTYFTKSLILEVSTNEMIITIEDVRELFLPNYPHQINFIFGKGEGRCTARQALANCMRSTPDRIFLAEVRGEEASDYIEVLNTGHPGGITSTHANNAISAFARIAKLIKKTDGGDIKDILEDVYSTIDISIYYKKRELNQIFFDPLYVYER